MAVDAHVSTLTKTPACGADLLTVNSADKETMIGRTVTTYESATESYSREVVSTGAVDGQ